MLLIEFHKAFAVEWVSDLFGFHVRLGFVSISADRNHVTAMLREWKRQIEELKAALRQEGK